jgi:hypothetical protein
MQNTKLYDDIEIFLQHFFSRRKKKKIELKEKLSEGAFHEIPAFTGITHQHSRFRQHC